MSSIHQAFKSTTVDIMQGFEFLAKLLTEDTKLKQQNQFLDVSVR